jgi:hypothetical protein
MINTPTALALARRLLADWPKANSAQYAQDRKPILAWMREAKPLVGFTSKDRPTSGIVFQLLRDGVALVEQEQRASQPAPQADALPALPPVITIHLPPYARKRAEELAEATTKANRDAARSSYAETVGYLREHEATLRAKAKKQAAWVMDEDVVRLLNLAAHLREAADMIETHVRTDEDNA